MHIPDVDAGEETGIAMAPLIDVVFLLLIFFMVATTYLDPERELEIDLPSAASGALPEAASDEIVIGVLRDGSLVLDGRAVAPDQLEAALRDAARHSRETPVTIRGDRRAVHEAIVGVLDACGTAGLSNLAVGTLER